MAIKGLMKVLPNATPEELQLAISGTSGEYFRSLPYELRDRATETIVAAMRNVFIPVYVGAAVCLILSVCFTVSFPPEGSRGQIPFEFTDNHHLNSNGDCSKILSPSRHRYICHVKKVIPKTWKLKACGSKSFLL
jgi:hypothetical protein